MALAATCALTLTLSGCASLRSEVEREPSHTITDGDRTTLGRVFAAQATQHTGKSGFQVMASGQSAFMTRSVLATAAERT
ncbi:MAG: phospholipase D family protein, partial [Rhodoferax sp.]|nr:phospholipase D family protein [Rhodoferax sp.]